jgi:hypothetical protein
MLGCQGYTREALDGGKLASGAVVAAHVAFAKAVGAGRDTKTASALAALSTAFFAELEARFAAA